MWLLKHNIYIYYKNNSKKTQLEYEHMKKS